MNATLKEFVQQGKLVVHLGAHKTATTYVQASLKAQRASLQATGVALVLPDDLRPQGVLRQTFGAGGKKARADQAGPDLAAFLDSISARPEVRQITISEESLMGAPRKNLARKSIYPDLDQRLQALPRALDHPNVTFLLSLRDYGSFISSNVTTAVRRGNVFDPEALRTAFLALHRNWVDVVDDLRHAFPAARLRIWRYEQFRALEEEIFAEFAKDAVPSRRSGMFKTLSGRAMRHIVDHRDPKAGVRENSQLAMTAARKYPVSAENPPFSLWSKEQAAHLTQVYELDWQRISRSIPDAVLKGD